MALLCTMVVVAGWTQDAFGKDGDSSGSGGDSGNSGSGDDSGSDNSGSGGDGEDGEDSDDGDDRSGSSGHDQDKVRDAVRKGDAIPLSRALALLKEKQFGRVIEVHYATKGRRIDYRFELINDDGKVVTVTMDARTGRIRRLFGF